MPDELFNYLVRNDDPRPQMGMAPGEKAWWTASRWDVLIQQAEEEGAPNRAVAVEMAFVKWSREVTGGAESVPPTHTLGNSQSSSKPLANRKGDWAGTDTVSRLFTDPLSMEMVLDTRSALPIYDHVLRQSMSVAMLQPPGAFLLARFWLAGRTLIQVTTTHLQRACVLIYFRFLTSPKAMGSTPPRLISKGPQSSQLPETRIPYRTGTTSIVTHSPRQNGSPTTKPPSKTSLTNYMPVS